MDLQLLTTILKSVADGQLSVADATEKLRHLSFEDIEFAHVDHHRSLRKGFPEVIFGQGKTAAQVIGIMDKMTHQENILLVTRIEADKAHTVITRFPEAVYHEDDCVDEKKTAIGRTWHDSRHFGRHIGYPGRKRSGLNRHGHGKRGRNHF
jgi:NCAIR mutase (PurE)-related protein